VGELDSSYLSLTGACICVKKVALIFGTRPEAVKLAPVYAALKDSDSIEPCIWVTGQHHEMLLQTLSSFALTPDRNLALMTPGQSLASITSRVVEKVSEVFEEEKPDLVLVQGDTTSAFAVSLAAFYNKIPVGHVEAGLRTPSRYSPFPEEMNRRIVSQIAEYHFAPTSWSEENLRKEGVPRERVWCTGNTVIDALQFILDKVRKEIPATIPEAVTSFLGDGKRMVLVTGHRRENFGAGFESLCSAIRTLAEQYADVNFLYPVHLNPQVQEPVHRILGGMSNVLLTDPLPYEAFVWLMDKSYFLLSDSGGVQEEAPHLGKPVLVMRESTERPEAVDAGTSLLVGTDEDSIISNVKKLLDDVSEYQKMSTAVNPYGDGKSAERIRGILEDVFLNE
jgi:UDP-N-acetylglucosamine 2-epimerase (non-hydrolysing)